MDATRLVDGRSGQKGLDFDILFMVGCFITKRKDLLSFISTCSDLYCTGVPVLLGFPCHIDATNLAAFHKFLVSKAPASFLGLRSLHLRFPVGGEHGPSMITDILSNAIKLTEFSISCSSLGPAPRTPAALPASQVLELDRYRDPRGQILAAIAQLKCPLSNLDIAFKGQDADVVTALSHFCPTLAQLRISNVALLQPAASTFRYCNVTRLTLRDVSNMRLSILLPALPRLVHLSFHTGEWIPEDTQQQLRADNLRYQREHPDQTWRLSSLSGGDECLYVLALQAPVDSVRCIAPQIRNEHPSRLTATLGPLCPVMLSVDNVVIPSDEMDWQPDEVPDECCRLVRLDLEWILEETMSLEDHQWRLDDLIEQLDLISDSSPDLVFLCIDVTDETDEDDEDRPTAVFLDKLDMRLLATQVLSAIPSLQMFRFSNYSRDVESYWIYPQGDVQFMRELPKPLHVKAERSMNPAAESTSVEILEQTVRYWFESETLEACTQTQHQLQ